MTLRSLLVQWGIIAPTIDVLAQLDAKLAVHSQEALRVEARALARKVKMESDPNRAELRRIDATRRDTVLRRFADDASDGVPDQRERHNAVSSAFQRRRDR